jgi:adenylyltransferase/sulfurtransferase
MNEIINIDNSRYSRLGLISWWNQDILKKSKVLVAGCGALGNEIIKNLAMLGVGNIYTVDMDTVERSNLTRSVLFRLEDEGKFKAETAAKRAKEINPDINFYYYNENIFNLGLNIFRESDIIIAGLDNREARLFINRSCIKVNKPWIDGGIEVLNGVARMFAPPYNVCYECTLNETDFALISKRKSCLLLGKDDIEVGKIPTTPTISSIIAGIQVQEAIKYLHKKDELPFLAGKGFVFNGFTNDSYIVEYQYKNDCMSHYTFENFSGIGKSFAESSFLDIDSAFKRLYGDKPYSIIFNNDIIFALEDETGLKREFFSNINNTRLSDITESGKLFKPLSVTNINLSSDIFEKFINRKLIDSGIPLNDILTVRSGESEIHFTFDYDEIFTEVK